MDYTVTKERKKKKEEEPGISCERDKFSWRTRFPVTSFLFSRNKEEKGRSIKNHFLRVSLK